ncbi:MAG TPA: DUF4384 domain-containing protein [Blastocatellia bacterium]|nr:DUF4384 domain-containing protein [Blastocatellia bacterium]
MKTGLCCPSAIVFCLLTACCLPALAQEGNTRQIFAEEFVKARPGKSSAGRKTAWRKVASKSAAALKSPDAGADSIRQLGLTIWRMRPAVSADTGARIIVQEGDDAAEWVPERVEAGTALRIGEHIRFSFEAPQAGWLYVIDREQYSDGSLGEPFLIFPTTRTRNGDNQISAGHIIEIPGQEDRPNFFTMKRTRGDQTGEVMTVVVTPQPLAEITVGPKALKLSSEQVAKWEKQWGAKTERFEMIGGAGKTWTRAEQEAGGGTTRQLTQDDPGPQTIYRVATRPGEPILVKVGLRYGQPKPRRQRPR